MGIEIVDNEDPFGIGIQSNGVCDVIGEVLLIPSGTDGRQQDISGGDLKIGNQRARAMADVVSILPFDRSRDGSAGWGCSLQGLDAGLLVTAAHLLGGCIERLLVSFVQLQPVAHAVRPQIDLLLKNDPRIGSRSSR